MTALSSSAAPSTSTRFPDGFVWGAATASFQIEGASTEDGRGPSIWDTLCAKPGAILDASDGSVACDHYHRWESDLDLLAELGLSAYRFSIAWPRVMPTGRGAINEKGLAFYDRLVDGLLARGIQPYATLYHWDLPQALEDDGGWRARDTAYRFADYAAITQFRLGDRVRHWATLNEPWCSAFLGHASGEHAPGRTEPAEAVLASHHLLLGHGLAAQALHGGRRPAEVGIVINLYDVTPASDAPADLEAARRFDGQQNRWYLDPVLRGSYPEDVVADHARFTDMSFVKDGDLETISTRLDWLGINYYSSFVVRGLDAPAEPVPGARPTPWLGTEDIEIVETGLPKTHMGWDVVPEGLTNTLVRVATRLRRAADLHHRERRRVRGRGRRRRGARRGSHGVRRRAPARLPRGRQPGRRPARLLHLVAHGQLRVGVGLHAALRRRARRLRHPAAHAEGQRQGVRRHRGEQRLALTPARGAPGPPERTGRLSWEARTTSSVGMTSR